MSSPDWGLNPGPLDYMSIAIPLSYLDYTQSSITHLTIYGPFHENEEHNFYLKVSNRVKIGIVHDY